MVSDEAEHITYRATIVQLAAPNYLRVTAAGVVTDNTKYYEDTFKAGLNHLEVKTTEDSVIVRKHASRSAFPWFKIISGGVGEFV